MPERIAPRRKCPAATFIRHDLIDESRIYVHPVLIGRGKRLFRMPETMTDLRFAETRTFGNGVVLLRYQRTGAGGRSAGVPQST